MNEPNDKFVCFAFSHGVILYYQQKILLTIKTQTTHFKSNYEWMAIAKSILKISPVLV